MVRATGGRALSTTSPHPLPASGSLTTLSQNKRHQRGTAVDYESFFKERLVTLRNEGRYRVFADLERRCGRFPRAYDHRIGAEVTAWCSNDYLGMGQHPAALAGMEETIRADTAGSGGTRSISGNRT